MMLFFIILNFVFSNLPCEEIRYNVYEPKIETKTNVILFVQGRNEFIEKYEHFYKFLNGLGYKVYTFDLRGQGLSKGTKCSIGDYNEYVEDLSNVVKKIPLNENQKIELIAHSTGALISILYLQQENDKKIDKVIFSSPFLGIVHGVPNFLLKIYIRLRSLIRSNQDRIPNYATNPDFKHNNQTHDYFLYNKFKDDKLKCGPPSYAWLLASINAFNTAFSGVSKLDVPITMLVAGQDTVVDVSRSKDFCKKLKDCKLVEFDGMYHELLNELDRNKVFRIIEDKLK